ncbi:UNVERIFIED_ORG: hypothetical protein ABIC54_003140 [Burkholderia sp. 1263]
MRVKTGVQGCPESAHLRHSSLPGERRALAGSLPDPVPAKPHLWKAGIFRRFLNSLTFCPAPAHRVPRTSSLNGPEIPHPGSRKASPHRARTPVQQGFAVALTSLTRVQGCLLLLLSSFTPRVHGQNRSTLATTRRWIRETVHNRLETDQFFSTTRTYRLLFVLFHGKIPLDLVYQSTFTPKAGQFASQRWLALNT